MRRLAGLVRPLGWLAGLALALDLLQLSSVVEHAKAIAACLERAKFELVLCEAPTTTD
jgi:hypothetical protein